MKKLLNKLFKRPIQPEPKYDIMQSLKKFYIEEDTEMSHIGLTHIRKDNIIETDNKIQFKKQPPSIYIYNNTKYVYNILKGLYPNDIIAQVKTYDVADTQILDMYSYTSVQYVYNILKQLNHTPQNDKELMSLAIDPKILSVCIKMIRIRRNLGKKAFDGSQVHQYELECLVCYRPYYYISSIEKVPDNINNRNINNRSINKNKNTP